MCGLALNEVNEIKEKGVGTCSIIAVVTIICQYFCYIISYATIKK